MARKRRLGGSTPREREEFAKAIRLELKGNFDEQYVKDYVDARRQGYGEAASRGIANRQQREALQKTKKPVSKPSIRLATDEQWSMMTAQQVGELLAVLNSREAGGGPATIDWVNRTIRVLSPVKERPDTIMSNGKPMMYQDIILELSGR